jgi:hypothetical protein
MMCVTDELRVGLSVVVGSSRVCFRVGQVRARRRDEAVETPPRRRMCHAVRRGW